MTELTKHPCYWCGQDCDTAGFICSQCSRLPPRPHDTPPDQRLRELAREALGLLADAETLVFSYAPYRDCNNFYYRCQRLRHRLGALLNDDNAIPGLKDGEQ